MRTLQGWRLPLVLFLLGIGNAGCQNMQQSQLDYSYEDGSGTQLPSGAYIKQSPYLTSNTQDLTETTRPASATSVDHTSKADAVVARLDVPVVSTEELPPTDMVTTSSQQNSDLQRIKGATPASLPEPVDEHAGTSTHSTVPPRTSDCVAASIVAPLGAGPMPTELAPVSHPPYTVAPPDILILTAEPFTPRPPYIIRPLDELSVFVSPEATLPKQPIVGKYTVNPDGMVNLGFNYGSVRLGGLSIRQSEAAIRRHLSETIKTGKASIIVGLEKFQGTQQIAGQHLVRPDGTISLGSFGSIQVAGMTLDQIKFLVEKRLSRYVLKPKVSVDVFAYNSKKYYVIYDGGGFGQVVLAFPYTGYETVLDAVSKTNGLPAVSSKKKIWVARPAPPHVGCSQVLPVHWRAITEGGVTATNYQLMPGDRVFVRADPLIATDNYLSKLLAPVERILGVTLLGSSTVNSIRNSGQNLGFIAVP